MTAVESNNIAAGLTSMARSRPDALAVLAPSGRDRRGTVRHVHWTFRQLDQQSDFHACYLRQQGIGPGVRTVLMVRPGLEFFSITFALFKAGAVPVLVDPGLGLKNVGACLEEAEPSAFLGVPEACLARKVLGWGQRTIKTIKAVGFPGDPVLSMTRAVVPDASTRPTLAPVEPDEMAAILFTSGSTGVPKGAVYTHSIFRAQVELLRQTYQIEPGEIDLCTFPLFALFGPILGMTCVVPEMNFTRPGHVNPTRIIEAVRDFGVTNLFGSPALIRRVGEYGEAHQIRLPSLRRVISAGAPVSAKILETFAGMLEADAQVFTPYGATESLPVCSIGSDEILGETRVRTEQGAGVCVGRAVEGMDLEIITISDEPISTWSDDLLVPDGEIGEIVVRGPVVTRAYYNRPEATALAKIDAGEGRFFHRMGDVGYRDPSGRVWFCGRKSHRVRTSSGTLFTIPCEGIFNTHPEVARSALVGVGDQPVLCVELRAQVGTRHRRDLDRLREELRALASRHEVTRTIATFLFHPSFPVDIRHNAKIFREKLADWAARQLR